MAYFYSTDSTDDGTWDNVSAFNNSATSMAMGNDGNSRHIFIRFPNITIPDGSTILTANVRFTASYSDTGATCNIRITANDVDNVTAAPTTRAAAEALVLTTAYVDWSPGSWSAGTTTNCTSPDLATVVQEIIDRPGWVNNNGLMLLFKNNGSSVNARRRSQTYDISTTAVRLSITWTPPTTEVDFSLDPSTGHSLACLRTVPSQLSVGASASTGLSSIAAAASNLVLNTTILQECLSNATALAQLDLSVLSGAGFAMFLSQFKTVNGLGIEYVKTINGLPSAYVKSINGLV